jgi:lipopolysaccharide export system permease protein
MIIGLIVGFCFYVLNQLVGPLSCVYQIPPALAAMLPTIIFAVVGMIFWV